MVAAVDEDWLREWVGALERPPPAHGVAQEYVCGRFRVYYDIKGPNAPEPWVSRTSITLPGTSTVVGETAPGGPPNYIQRVCFWLTRARQRFLGDGFRDAPPAGEIRVFVTTRFTGGYARNGEVWINAGLPEDELAQLLVHEYMHLVQEGYEGSVKGPWYNGREGGSVLAEEFVVPGANTHIGFANGRDGILSKPQDSLGNRSYPFSLLLHYLAEQHPQGGAWVYRRWLEIFVAGGNDPVDLGVTLRDLWPVPPSQGIRHVGAAWPPEDALLGNFWLACALKDLAETAPDPRFGFACNAEFGILENRNRYGRLRPVQVAWDLLVRRGERYVSVCALNSYAARFFRVEVASSVDRVKLTFHSGAGLTRPLLQVAIVEPGHSLREIVRTTANSWSETFESEQDGIRIHHLWVVVATTEAGGSFCLEVEGHA